MSKKILLFLSLLVNIAAFSQETDILQTTQKNPDTSIFKGGFSEPIDRMWELREPYKRGTFSLKAHRPNYIILSRYSSLPNRQPVSLNANREVPEYKNYQNIEAKFQVSLKAKVLQGAFWNKGDLWVGFTQQSFWQVYNGKMSRPFRETNYEPELMFIYPLNLSAGKFRIKMAGISVNHQSNGKEELLSRSWNRLILMTAFEWGDFAITNKLWQRFTEKGDDDDNPSIEEYVGRTEFTIGYTRKKHIFSLVLRNNLNFKHNRGFAEFSWIYPIKGTLKMMFQASHGYGDSLIDYNHKQTIIGVGAIFLPM